MGIHDDDVARVRSAADLVQIIGEHTEIKRSGRSWMARCPLHGERTPSLSVSPEKGVYYCFGCQRSGDAITFVREIDNLDFVGAVESLAGRYGVTLRYTTKDEGARRSRQRSLLDAVDKGVEFYHQRLRKGPDAGEARRYLRNRGYDRDLIIRYKLGWAPDDWDQLARHVKLSDDDLRDSGLGFVNKAARQQDAFRGRVMFPITDDQGNSVGFGGRILPGHEGSKYKNTTTEASVYDKSSVLYGLHPHRASIVRVGQAIICEGYTDVIAYATAGIPLAVATCGTALTEQHVKLLKRFSANRLILSFDADAAGFAAAERVYAWEKQYELEIFVAALPRDSDPDDLARTNPAALQQALDNAVPFLQFRLERVLESGDRSTNEGEVRTSEQCIDIIREHPKRAVRDKYAIDLADELGLDREETRKMVKGGVRTATPSGGTAPPLKIRPEDEAIRVAIHRPDEVSNRLSPSLFVDPVRREAFTALEQYGVLVPADLVGPEAAGLLRRLAVDSSDVTTDDALARLAHTATGWILSDLMRHVKVSPSAEDRQDLVSAIPWLKTQEERLESSQREAALAELLPWLTEYLDSQDLDSQNCDRGDV